MSRNGRVVQLLGLAAFLVACTQSDGQGDQREEKKGTPRSDLPYTEIRLPPGRAHEVVFSHDGTMVAVGVAAKVVVYTIAGGKEVVRMQLPQAQSWHRLAFAADGKTLTWLGHEDRTGRVFDIKTGKQVREFPYPAGAAVQCLSPDATRVVYAVKAGDIDVREVATNKLVTHIDAADWAYPVFTPDGKSIALRNGEKGVRLYDAATGKLLQLIDGADPRDPPSGFEFLAFSRDGARMAAWGRKPFVDCWDVKSGKRVCAVRATHWYHTAQFCRDGKSLLCTNSANEAVLHNLILEKVIHRFAAPVVPYAAALTPDEKKVVIVSSSTVPTGVGYQYSLYVYDLPPHFLDPPAARAIDDTELAALWHDLQGDNDLRFQLAVKAFRASPAPAIAVVRQRMPPASMGQQKQVEGWITALDDGDFQRRDAAMESLHGVAHAFAPLLSSRLAMAGPGETRNRLTFVLDQMRKDKTPSPLVRELRVVALLEQLDTAEARRLLGELADGAPGARLTVEARLALQRIGK